MHDVAIVISASAVFLGVVIKGAPEYRRLVDWRDRRKRRQVRAISAVSPTTGTITKRSA